MAPALEIFSDTACPYAYLADAKFRRACETIGKAHVGFEPRWNSVAFRPYLLSPELEGAAPTPKIAHLEAKHGKPFNEMGSMIQLKERGLEFGLHYRFDPSDLASGTLDSHRVLRYVDTQGGPQAAFAYRRHLMKAFNEEGKALSDWSLLLEAVERVGADRDVAAAVLEGGAYALDVKWLDREARKEGIDVSPHYRFHTPTGVHSVAGSDEEDWHYLDAIYRSFPEQPQWGNWAEAAAKARTTAEAFSTLGERRQEGEGEGEVGAAEEVADAAVRAYRERFLQ